MASPRLSVPSSFDISTPFAMGVELHTHIQFKEHTGFLFVYPVVGRQGLHNLYSDLM